MGSKAMLKLTPGETWLRISVDIILSTNHCFPLIELHSHTTGVLLRRPPKTVAFLFISKKGNPLQNKTTPVCQTRSASCRLPEDLLHCWPCPGRAPDHVHQGLDLRSYWAGPAGPAGVDKNLYGGINHLTPASGFFPTQHRRVTVLEVSTHSLQVLVVNGYNLVTKRGTPELKSAFIRGVAIAAAHNSLLPALLRVPLSPSPKTLKDLKYPALLE